MHDTTSTALSAFDIAAILVVASALLGWFNHHFLKLPHVIGLTVMGALGAIGLTVADAFIPGVTLDDWVADTLQQMNFTETLLQGMLSFLLFAGAPCPARGNRGGSHQGAGRLITPLPRRASFAIGALSLLAGLFKPLRRSSVPG